MTGKGYAALFAIILTVILFVLRSPNCTKPASLDKAAKIDTSLSGLEKLEKELEDWQEREEKLEKMYNTKINRGESGSDVEPSLIKAQNKVKELEEKLRIMKNSENNP